MDINKYDDLPVESPVGLQAPTDEEFRWRGVRVRWPMAATSTATGTAATAGAEASASTQAVPSLMQPPPAAPSVRRDSHYVKTSNRSNNSICNGRLTPVTSIHICNGCCLAPLPISAPGRPRGWPPQRPLPMWTSGNELLKRPLHEFFH
jgi:hypothetical protein